MLYPSFLHRVSARNANGIFSYFNYERDVLYFQEGCLYPSDRPVTSLLEKLDASELSQVQHVAITNGLDNLHTSREDKMRGRFPLSGIRTLTHVLTSGRRGEVIPGNIDMALTTISTSPGEYQAWNLSDASTPVRIHTSNHISEVATYSLFYGDSHNFWCPMGH